MLKKFFCQFTTARMRSICSLAVLLLGATIPIYAQLDSGSISGTVTDPSGSVIPGANLQIKDPNSGTNYSAVTTSAGYYTVPSVRPGSYQITVTAPGFADSVRTGISVFVNTRSAQDFQLKTGTAEQTVEVSANALEVESESSDIGTIITPKQVIELPLAVGGAFRSLSTLAFLAPGAVGPGTNGGTTFAKIGGGQTEGSDFLLDGISTLRSENGSGQFDQTTPSVDAMQEFRIETSSLPAYLGRTTGGVANFKSAAGANEYHGVIYEFYKNAALDANSWFNNLYLSQQTTAAGRTQFQRPPDTKNDYGITLGGPLRIPHLYNGRDKTFFFFSFEQLRFATGGSPTSTLPTAAERNGDFSATLGAPLAGNPVNPCTGQVILAGQIFDPNTTQNVGGVLCRTPFPNNQVPTNRSAIAQNVLSYVPTPNLPGQTNNYVYPETDQIANTSYSVRVDQNAGARNHFFGFFSSRENSDQGSLSLPVPIENGAQNQDFFAKYFRGGWDFTINPRIVNELTIGSNRINSFNVSRTSLLGTNWDEKLGIANTPQAGYTFPVFTVGESVPQFGEANHDDNVDSAIIGNDILDWQKGAHNLRIGGTVRWQQFSYTNSGPAAGDFSFGRAQTAATPDFTAASGNGIASFLLGAPGSISRTLQLHAPRWISNYYAVYIQDDWKARQNLTLNLGFRWSVDTPRHEAEGDTSSLDPTEPNPGANNILGALAFGGVGPGRNGNKAESWASNYYKDFEPRVGFAYAPDSFHGKMAIRGSYEILYGPLVYADFGQGLSTGFTQLLQYHNGNGFLPNGPLDAGFPVPNIGINTDPSQLNGQGIDYVAKDYARPAMVQNWSLEQQLEIAPDLVFTLGYIGEHSTRLHALLNEPNTMPQQYLQYGDLLNSPITSPQAVAAGFTPPFANFNTIWGPSAPVEQALRPFSQYGYINTDSYLQNSGQSTYHALEAKLQRQFRNGLNLLASYTFSKTITDADSIQPYYATVLGQGGVQNPFDQKAEKAVSTQDVPNNFVVSYLYDLPVGRGKHFLSHVPKPVDLAIGNWRVGGIQRYLSGQPISFFGAQGIPGFDTGIRFNRVPGTNPRLADIRSGSFNPLSYAGPSSAGSAFNPAAFIDPNAGRAANAPYQFGTMPRNSPDIRTPPFYDEDLNVNKTFPIKENVNVEFRAELFDAFNRHVFAKPDSGVNDPTFGQVTGTILSPRNVQFVLRIHY